jgi:hypothetical protein
MSEAASTEPTFDELAAAADKAIRDVGRLDAHARGAANRMRAAIEDFHRGALVHIVKELRADPRGKELLFDLVDEPSVRAVFSLHGIIETDPLPVNTPSANPTTDAFIPIESIGVRRSADDGPPRTDGD